ncbi:MAG: hypothetical protein R3338_09125, partial [Thermoanaerobaculia bacterium]|nr:hypothetical protein [Thermoanaerobaculia bacterium]
GGEPVPVPLSDIVEAATAINEGFVECRFFLGCGSAVNTLSGALEISAVNPDLTICEVLQPVTFWDVRNGFISLRHGVEEPDVPASVLQALERLGLPATVGGLAELERMTLEGHGYLGGVESGEILDTALRVLQISRGADTIRLCH